MEVACRLPAVRENMLFYVIRALAPVRLRPDGKWLRSHPALGVAWCAAVCNAAAKATVFAEVRRILSQGKRV